MHFDDASSTVPFITNFFRSTRRVCPSGGCAGVAGPARESGGERSSMATRTLDADEQVDDVRRRQRYADVARPHRDHEDLVALVVGLELADGGVARRPPTSSR